MPRRSRNAPATWLSTAAAIASATCATAHAQDIFPGPTRTSFAVALEAGANGTQEANVFGSGTGAAGVLGAYLHVGDQITDEWGIEAEASAGTIHFDSAYWHAALMGTWTYGDWLTLGLGPATGGNGGSSSGGSFYVGGGARIDFHLWVTRAEHGRRRALTLGLGVDLGGTLTFPASASGWASGGFVRVGYAWY